MIELFPWAMFANGPQCIIAGVFSRVWMRLGFRASFRTTVMTPAALKSSAVTGFPSFVCATTILPRRFLRSFRSDASAMMAMTSDATVMS